MTGLTRRFLLLFTPLLLASSLAAAAMIANRIDGALESVRESRYVSLALSLASAFEADLDLGFPIEAQRGPLQELRFAIERDTSLLSIDVFDTTGRLIFTTDRGGVGERVPPAWTARARSDGPRGWVIDDGTERISGASIVNNFGKVVAAVALRRATGGGEVPLLAIATAGPTAIAVLLGSAFLLLTVIWVVRPVDRMAVRAADRLERGGDRPPANDLERAADAFRARAQATEATIAKATDVLREIDDAG